MQGNLPLDAKTPPLEENSTRFAPPTLQQVKMQAASIGLSDIEADKFFHFYESKGWKVGKAIMKKWKSAIAGWKIRCDERNSRIEQKQNAPSKPNENVMRMQWREEMTRIEKALKELPKPVVNRWLETDEQVETKLKPWRERRAKLVERKNELLKNLGMIV